MSERVRVRTDPAIVMIVYAVHNDSRTGFLGQRPHRIFHAAACDLVPDELQALSAVGVGMT